MAGFYSPYSPSPYGPAMVPGGFGGSVYGSAGPYGGGYGVPQPSPYMYSGFNPYGGGFGPSPYSNMYPQQEYGGRPNGKSNRSSYVVTVNEGEYSSKGSGSGRVGAPIRTKIRDAGTADNFYTKSEVTGICTDAADGISPYVFKRPSGEELTVLIERKAGLGPSGEGHVGGIVWNAAKALAQYMCQLPDGYWEGKRVLELGAGTGLCGFVAAALGADVIITDQAPVLPLIQNNIDLNTDLPGTCVAKELDWGHEGDHQIEALLADGPFDVVLGADVTYSALDLLSYSMRTLCAADPASFVLLAHTKRWRGSHYLFKEATVPYFTIKENMAVHVNDDNSVIQILSLLLKR